MKDEYLYLQARSEVDSSRRIPAIWAKAMSVTNNDEIVSRYAYIALRMEQLVEQEQTRKTSTAQPASSAKEEHPLADLDGTMHTSMPAAAPASAPTTAPTTASAAVQQDQSYQAREPAPRQPQQTHQVQESEPRRQQQTHQASESQARQQTKTSDELVHSDDPTLMALPEFSRISGMTEAQSVARLQNEQHALVATNGAHFVKRDAVTPVMQSRTFASGELVERANKGGKGWLKTFGFLQIVVILALVGLVLFFPSLVTNAIEWIKSTIPALSGLTG